MILIYPLYDHRSNVFLAAKGKDVNFKEYKLSTLVSVLRTFLNKLPVPLLTVEMCDPFLGATRK